MNNPLYYEIIRLTPTISISVLNLIIWVGLFFAARYSRKAVAIYVRKKNIHNQQITLAGKEIPFVSLAKQVINILFVIIALQSLSITNNGSGLKELLDIKLLETGRFNITIYNVFLVVILIVTAKMLNTFAKMFIHRNLSDKDWIDKGRLYTITVLVQYVIYTVFIVIGVKSFGIDLTLLVASSAALFVGIGLGIQRIFTDFISGFIILFEGDIKVGDIVQTPEGPSRIVQINIRTSKARTTNGNVIVLPNSKLTTENVNHWSYNDKPVRYSISIYVSPDTEAAEAKKILYDTVLDHKFVDKTKTVQILLEEFTESNQHYKVYFWTERIWEVEVIKSDLRYAIEEVLRKKGVKAASPAIKFYDKEKSSGIPPVI